MVKVIRIEMQRYERKLTPYTISKSYDVTKWEDFIKGGKS